MKQVQNTLQKLFHVSQILLVSNNFKQSQVCLFFKTQTSHLLDFYIGFYFYVDSLSFSDSLSMILSFPFTESWTSVKKKVMVERKQSWMHCVLFGKRAATGWGKKKDKVKNYSETCLGKSSELYIHLFHTNLSPMAFGPIINAALKQEEHRKISTTFGRDKCLQRNRLIIGIVKTDYKVFCYVLLK